MKVLELIDQLEDLIENASAVPFSAKVMVSKSEIEQIMQDLRVTLPDDVKQAKWIKDEREKLIADAEEESKRMLKSADDNASMVLKDAKLQAEELVAKDEITRRAEERATEIIDNANNQAVQIRDGAYQYAENIMTKLESNLEKFNQSVAKNKSELLSYRMKNNEMNA